MVTLTPIQFDLILLSGAFLYVALIIGISIILKKTDIISSHSARKIVHLFAGFAVFIVPYLSIPFLALIISGSVLIFTRFAGPKNIGKPVFEAIAEKDEHEKGYLSGPFSYALAINILVFIFSFENAVRYFYFPASSIMVMMISDTAAAWVGRKWGTHKIDLKYTKTVRTIEGSITMFISAFLLSFFGFSFFGLWFPNSIQQMNYSWIALLSLLMAANSTVVEIFSPSNIDDLTVPITGCLLTFGLTVLLFPASIGL
jgi:dolichol kinase